MPIHRWNQATAGYFHHFHQRWTGAICDSLNPGILPKGIFAMPLFLDWKAYIRVPLEETYQATWNACPAEFKDRVTGSAGRL